MELLAKVFEPVKLLLKYGIQMLLGLWLVSLAALVVPNDWLRFLGLYGIVSQYWPYITTTFAVSSAMLIASGAVALAKRAAKWLAAHRGQRRGHRRLHNLTQGERRVLWGFVQPTGLSRTANLLPSGDVVALVDAGILYPASELPTRSVSPLGMVELDEYAFNLTDWAFDYLRRYPELLIRPDKQE